MVKKEIDHHVPRNINKNKRHKHGFNEDAQEQRRVRVSFKNYLREIEEQELELNEDFEALTDEDYPFIISDFKEFSKGRSPGECSDDELQEYAYDYSPAAFDEQEILEFLRNYTGE